MRSTINKNADDFDLERGLRLTPADLEALDRARAVRPRSFEKYLRWLSEITAGVPSSRDDLNTMADTPFEL
jgi:hypothetical protein